MRTSAVRNAANGSTLRVRVLYSFTAQTSSGSDNPAPGFFFRALALQSGEPLLEFDEPALHAGDRIGRRIRHLDPRKVGHEANRLPILCDDPRGDPDDRSVRGHVLDDDGAPAD